MRRFIMFGFVIGFLLAVAVPAFSVEDTDTVDVAKTVSGNDLIIDDEADLLTAGEESSLENQMAELCEYGDAIVVTLAENDNTTNYAADSILREYGNDGLVFLIDMDNREIYLFTTYDTLSTSKCYTITDNTYTYASSGMYYECISDSLEQCQQVLNGERIAQPMKYIDNALMAIIIAMIITFIWLASTARKRKAEFYEMTDGRTASLNIDNPKLQATGTRVVRHDPPPTSVGGGGGGFSGGGGGGHGGGHSF